MNNTPNQNQSFNHTFTNTNPYINPQKNIIPFQAPLNEPQNKANFFTSKSTQKDLFKGMLIGAAATFILTNESAQKAIFKNFAKISSLLEMGIEELKERYEDAKAEVN